MKIEELNELDLSYTPPLSSPWDPVQIGAQLSTKALPNTFLLLFASRLISGHRECTGADVGRPETAAVGGNRQAGSVEPRCGWEVSQARSRSIDGNGRVAH